MSSREPTVEPRLNAMTASQPFIFELDPENCGDNMKRYRAAFSTDGDAYEWIASYGQATKTSWIVDWEVYNPRRVVFHKKWKCKRSSRNKTAARMSTNCPAYVDIKIKKITRDTKLRDPFLRRTVPLPAIIQLREDHNHVVGDADELRLLPSTPDTRALFLSYFNDGLSPAEAIAVHRQKLNSQDDGAEKLASGASNPKSYTVYNWFQMWRKRREQQLNASTDSITKVEEKAASYLEKGADVRTTMSEDGKYWAILMVTQTMKRVQELAIARKAIFVDSTASCDGSQHAVTVLLAATPVGALPLAVLLHNSQSMESYKFAFNFLKQNYPAPFYDTDTPQAFITENLAAEKAALKATWPAATQFLNHFHVALAEWLWLQESSDINKGCRRTLMTAFHKIMYASSADDLTAALSELQQPPHKEYAARVGVLLEQKTEWVLLFRSGIATRGLNEIILAEASVRVLKDVVLHWCEVYDAVALVDLVTTVWEEHFRKRLVEHAYNRVPACSFLYDSLLQRMHIEASQAIHTLGGSVFQVPSEDQDGEMHEVWQTIGSCTCQAGQKGAFCKHQVIVHETYGGGFPDAPTLTAQDRLLLAGIALGDVKCQEFFPNLQEAPPQQPCSSTSIGEGSVVTLEPLPQVNHLKDVEPEPNMEDQTPNQEDVEPDLGDQTPNHQHHEDSAEVLRQIHQEQWRHLSVAGDNPSYLAALQRLLAEMKKVRTEPQIIAMYLAMEAAYARVLRRRARITKVQPLGVARARGRDKNGHASSSRNSRKRRVPQDSCETGC